MTPAAFARRQRTYGGCPDSEARFMTGVPVRPAPAIVRDAVLGGTAQARASWMGWGGSGVRAIQARGHFREEPQGRAGSRGPAHGDGVVASENVSVLGLAGPWALDPVPSCPFSTTPHSAVQWQLSGRQQRQEKARSAQSRNRRPGPRPGRQEEPKCSISTDSH